MNERREGYIAGWKGAMRGVDAEVIWAENQHRHAKTDESKGYLEAQKYLQSLVARKLTRMMLTGGADDAEDQP